MTAWWPRSSPRRSAKLGDDEAQHQVAAIKKRCGTDYAKALSEIRAYNDSIPGGDK